MILDKLGIGGQVYLLRSFSSWTTSRQGKAGPGEACKGNSGWRQEEPAQRSHLRMAIA